MYKKIVIAVLFIILFSVNASAQKKQDGNHWLEISKLSQINYIVGLIKGVYKGMGILEIELLKNGSIDCHKIAYDLQTKWSDKYFNANAGQIQDGLTQFFTDYRYRNIMIEDGFSIVLMEIAGDERSEIERIIKIYKERARSLK